MLKRGSFLLVLLSLWAAAAWADTLVFDQVNVRGNRRVDTGAITSEISIRPGREVERGDVDRDLQAIFALGRFSDVRAEVEEEAGQRSLVFVVDEKPLVRQVLFSGNDELSEDELRELVTLRPPDIYHHRKLRESIEAISAAYTEEGFYGATVTPRLEVDEDNEAVLTLEIDEGEKVLIESIRFAGNTVFSDKELKKSMETRERWFLSWLTGRGTYRPEVLTNDLEIIADKYYNLGYIQVKVRQPVVTVSEDQESLDVLVEIEEGEQFRIGTIDVTGDLIEEREELLALTKLGEGEIFGRKQLRESVFALHDLYADRGYAYVNVAPLTEVDADRRLVDLVYDIEQGIQVHIDRILISGNTKTRDKVIRREMKIVEGDLYNFSKLKESRRRINNLGFFDQVDVSTSSGASEDQMNVDVEVQERPTGTFSLGFGYSSVDGVFGQGSVTQENFLGRAWKLNLAGSFGGESTTYQVGLLEPYFLDTKISLGFDLYNTRREWNEFTEKTSGGDLKFGFPVTENSRFFFIYRYEEKEILDIDPAASQVIRDQEGESTLSALSGSWTHDTTDYRMDPSEGGIFQVTGELAGIGGTEKYAKLLLDHRHFWPFKWDTVFSVHGRVGQIWEVGGEEIPLDERFRLGGLTTLRGFESRTVGPKVRRVEGIVDPETGDIVGEVEEFDVIGGDKEAFFNLEYIFPIKKDMGLKGLVFFDTGNAWDSDEDFLSDMRYSVGGGIRWFSPMGPLRLEWGYNLDPREDEPNSEFEFSIGKFF